MKTIILLLFALFILVSSANAQLVLTQNEVDNSTLKALDPENYIESEVAENNPFNSNEPDTNNRRLLEALPNPARNYTWLPYVIPSNTQNAKIVVRNLVGNIVISEPVDPQNDRIRINTQNLSKGIYIYSLIIEDQLIQSKRLIVVN